MSEMFETSKDVAWLKDLYFTDPARQLILQPGEKLLQEGTFNDKLFLILLGSVTGYLQDENGDNFEVFISKPNMFLGVYSFFSQEHITYLTIVANKPTIVAYIDNDVRRRHGDVFATHFLPVIVHELYLRQLLAQRLTWQRQAAIRKLYESEKMALLGQLASGLAHELNNSVGVLHRNTEWLIQSLSEYLNNKKLSTVFENALQEGLAIDTRAVRAKMKSLEKNLSLPSKLAKQLAKSHLTEDEIKSLLKQPREVVENLNLITEAGYVLHDMRVASDHSAHVVQSVRELGSGQREVTSDVSISKTVHQALALLKSLLQDVHVDMDRNQDAMIRANAGDLVQIWLNLIKNAGESLVTSSTPDPQIKIMITSNPDSHCVDICDNGPGIADDVLTRIFEPNFTTKVKGLSFGLGLGLSIVKKIINNHKGNIAVRSVPGETVFTVCFPVKPTARQDNL
jgi:C4-dicarboxylate-specific signal transduction histidine kinase